MYEDIISFENLLTSWQEFVRGKRKRDDVAEFLVHGMDGILALHRDLKSRAYQHGIYQAFRVHDPKPRDIHKATVRDRLLHHALYRILYPYFDRKFIFDSYSCRRKKGTHRALNRFREYGNIVSRNHTRTAWILKCDIRKFFASIDHRTLKSVLARYIHDTDVLWLLACVIDSFHTPGKSGVGLPLGNLTSQLLVNIYMNEFDQFVKRSLRMKYYIRYADDFVLFHEDREVLETIIPAISRMLRDALCIELHPQKISLQTISSGVDFLGWVHFPRHRVLRTSTKRRMFRMVSGCRTPEVVASYRGLLGHGNTWKLVSRVLYRLRASQVAFPSEP